MLNFVLSLLCIIPFSLEGACSPFLFSAVWALCMGPWLGESARAKAGFFRLFFFHFTFVRFPMPFFEMLAIGDSLREDTVLNDLK